MAETVTIVGNVGNDPHHIVTPTGLSITKFPVGCTHRVFDPATKTWTDKYTNWYQVSTFRQVADHAHASIKRGDSVIVTGRIVQRQWEANGKAGTSIDLEADTVGHDLRWGTSTWRRAPKQGAEGSPVEAGQGASPQQGVEQAWAVPGAGQGSDAASAPSAAAPAAVNGNGHDNTDWPAPQAGDGDETPF